MSAHENYWLANRVGRRVVLRGAALAGAGLAGAAIIGCSDEEEPAAAPPTVGGGGGTATAGENTGATSAKYSGTFRLSTTTIESNLDVYMTQGTSSLFAQISERLITLDPSTLDLKPGLLASWEEVEPGLEFILHIQPDAVWEDREPTGGRPFDSEDVRWNLLYGGEYTDHDNTAQRASWYFGIEDIETVDEKTVRLRLNTPNGAILSAMADHRQHMMPKEVPDEYGWDNYPNFPSVGPFIMDQFGQGDRGIFTRNPNYYMKDGGGNAMPFFDGVDLAWYGDAASAYAALLAGDLDILAINQIQAADLEADPSSDINLYRFPFRRRDFLLLNAEQYPDPRVWKAIHNLIDYQTLIDTIYLGAASYTGVVPPTFAQALSPDEVRGLPGFNPDTREEEIAEAFKLLDSAGFPEGAGLVLESTASATSGTRFDVGIVIQGTLADVAPGITFTTRAPTDGPSFQRALLAGELSAITHGQSDGPDIRLAIQSYQTGHSRNWSKFSDPDIDALIERMHQERGEALAETFADFESRLIGGNTPVFSVGVDQYMATSTRVHGLAERGGFEGANNDDKIGAHHYWFEE